MEEIGMVWKYVIRKVLFSGAFLTYFFFHLQGQTINDYQQRWNNLKGTYGNEGLEFMPFLQSEFYKLAQGRDDELAEYLGENWRTYVIFPGTIFPKSIAPVSQPYFSLDELTLGPPKKLPFNLPDPFWLANPDDKLIIPRVRKDERETLTPLRSTFQFYGNEIRIHYDELLASSDAVSVNEGSVALFWQIFSKANSNQLVDQLMDYRDQLGLDDWGYMQLVKSCATAVYSDNPHSSRMLSWALMLRSGYQVKIGYTRDKGVLLFPATSMIYALPFVTIGEQKYYLDENIAGLQVTTYVNHHPGASRAIDLSLTRSLNFRGTLVPKRFPFDWGGRHFEFVIHYNPEIIHYYETFPKTGAKEVFEAPVSSGMKEELFRQFYPIVSRMGKIEASAFLQQFVQSAFPYRSYNDLYGHDRFLFPEEMIASEGANDKGRAVFFSWMVRHLLRLPVAALEFPGFYSVAIAYDKTIDGDYYVWNDRKYTLADPTWLSAPIGLLLPGFSGVRPRLLPLQDHYGELVAQQKVWNFAYRLGARRGGALRDLVTDKAGNSYLTGFFEDQQRGNRRVSYPFVACFDAFHSLKWIQKFTSTDRAYGFSIAMTGPDEIYIAGSLSGELELGAFRLESAPLKSDLFFAQFNSRGELVWIRKSGLDLLGVEENLTYAVRFDRSGDNFFVNVMNEESRNIAPGFRVPGRHWIYFNGSTDQLTGMKRQGYGRPVPPANLLAQLKRERSELAGAGHSPAISGIAALIRLLNREQTDLTGVMVQDLLIGLNPEFKTQSSEIYTAIGELEQIRQRDGLITVTTVDRRKVTIGQLVFNGNACFSVEEFGNQDLLIRAVTGIDYSRSVIRTNLNTLLIDVSSGNLLFDFGVDHTLRTVNFARTFMQPAR